LRQLRCCLVPATSNVSSFLPDFPQRDVAFRASRYRPARPSAGYSPRLYGAGRLHPAGPWSPKAEQRYYSGSDSCPWSPPPTGIPAYCAPPSDRSIPNHVMPRDQRLIPPTQRDHWLSGFALRSQARRNIPPNRVRAPTDQSFVSGYSPPRLTTTQLPSTTEPWHTRTRTSTVLTVRPHGRTTAAVPPAGGPEAGGPRIYRTGADK
jgi:hypothetical protein